MKDIPAPKTAADNVLFSTSWEAVCFYICVGVYKREGWCWGREQSEVIRREHHNILQLLENKHKTLILSSLETPEAHSGWCLRDTK